MSFEIHTKRFACHLLVTVAPSGPTTESLSHAAASNAPIDSPPNTPANNLTGAATETVSACAPLNVLSRSPSSSPSPKFIPSSLTNRNLQKEKKSNTIP